MLHLKLRLFLFLALWFSAQFFVLTAEPDWTGSEWIEPKLEPQDHEHASRIYITHRMDAPEERQSLPSPLIRKTFDASSSLKSATAHIVGLGYYELYLNGHRVGDRVLDPAQSNYEDLCFYVSHEVTELIQKGENAIGIWLGNGFYGQNITWGGVTYYGPPCARMVLELEYQDGRVENVATDSSWKTSVSPIVFNNVYGGEAYDARLEQDGWAEAEFDDDTWESVEIVEGPGGELVPQSIPPIRRVRELQAVSVTKATSGNYLIDFGENISGWIRIQLEEERGTEVSITYAEHLQPDGTGVNIDSTGAFATGLPQKDVYICKGDGLESWEPRFTYHGFRYVEIEGLSQALAPEQVKAVFAYTDLESAGSFRCSDPLINEMIEVSLRTIRGNLHSIPEDCPHREKCGWTGDVHLVAESVMFHFEAEEFFRKYLRDIEGNLGKGTSGFYPGQETVKGMTPTMIAPGKRTAGQSTTDWGVAVIFLPYFMETYYGDEAAVDHFYPYMKEWAKFEWSFYEEGLIKHGLGDWCAPRWDRQTAPDAWDCNPHVSATLHYLHALNLIRKTSEQKGDEAFLSWMNSRYKELYSEFHKNYLKALEGHDAWTYGSQTAMALALRYDLVPTEKKEAVLRGLIWDIKERHGGHHSCGAFGLKHLFTVLCENGYGALAHEILTVPTFPSHAYFLSKDFTTWPERQMEVKLGQAFRDRSSNHLFHSSFIATFHEAVAGIRPAKGAVGLDRLEMRPAMFESLDWVVASYETPYGLICSEWRIEEGEFFWEIELPEGVEAEVWLPEKSQESGNLNWIKQSI
ncbi:MAG: glycoside hydrolase family 78 protein, partial [Opitutales bacterium]|nr:glycoside hydrolase family 78 protein [Opitutales bacterium]